LLRSSGNSTPSTLRFLATDYPSHGFVIDRDEASMLFSNVREPDEAEAALAERIGEKARWPSVRGGETNVIEILSDEPAEKFESEEELTQQEDADGESRGAATAKPERVAESSGEQLAPSVARQEGGTVTPFTGDHERAGKRIT
jgi:hypothetical protein